MSILDERILYTQFPMDLQWFAAEDEGRTEEPTEYKIKKAREEGRVAKSSEFTSSLVLLFPIIALGLLGTYIIETILEMLNYFFGVSAEVDILTDNRLIPAFFNYFLKLTLPIFATAFVSAILGNIFQVGFLFSSKPIKPDLKRIMPKFGQFFKRAFLSKEALFNLAKSLGKVAVIAIIAFFNIRSQVDEISRFVTTPFWLNMVTIGGIAFRIMIESALAMMIIAIPDYFFQRKQYRESLKMTKQEVKEERKMHEGDPLVQARLRERMREILSRNMIQNVPRADVVVTNPTHYAVAMEWKRSEMIAPMVIAKGQDHLAHRIKDVAQESEIPVIENKPLARALYADVEIGDVIPEKYYEVMAIVMAEVYKMTGKSAEAVS